MDFRITLAKAIKYKSFKILFKWLISLSNIFRGNEIVEDSIFRDIQLELFNYFNYFKKGINFLYFRLFSRFMGHKDDVPEFENGMNIAFVCLGNICRSPFAELYARKHYSDYHFHSFGFLKQNNRLPPLNAVKAAQNWNIDLYYKTSKSNGRRHKKDGRDPDYG